MLLDEWLDFIEDNKICTEDFENIIFDRELSLGDVDCLVNRLRLKYWLE